MAYPTLAHKSTLLRGAIGSFACLPALMLVGRNEGPRPGAVLRRKTLGEANRLQNSSHFAGAAAAGLLLGVVSEGAVTFSATSLEPGARISGEVEGKLFQTNCLE